MSVLTAKNCSSRTHDFIYDPIFTVSGPKDHNKAAMIATKLDAKFQVCPIFPSMFSDLPHRPRTQLVLRKMVNIPTYEDLIRDASKSSGHDSRGLDVMGADRHKFFKIPVAELAMGFESLGESRPHSTHVKSSRSTFASRQFEKNCKVQTQYRESTVQTSPWQPDHRIMDGSNPEILKLDFLKWGSGLPAGMHEIRLIQRARMKQEWEKAMPPMTNGVAMEKGRMIIEAMERDEWAFREQEIQDIHNLRMELLEKMLSELHEKSKCRSEKKIKMFCELKQAEKEAKLAKLRHKTEREMRKLKMKHKGINRKYHTTNIVDEHADHSSELYGPLMRHGEHPKRFHQNIDKRMKTYKSQFIGVENSSTLPRWLYGATKIKDSNCIKLPGTRLCIRETKWTTPILKQLHEELKNLRKNTKRICRLRTRLGSIESEAETPEVDGIDDTDEDNYQASILIESVLRGRASQMLIYEGRDRCRELIQELRSTHGLQKRQIIEKYQERVEVKFLQREENINTRNTKCLQEALSRLQGTIVGSLLDFLNKELRRLLDERRAHAVCLLVGRERQNREAAEAGRRQAELRRRAEHDEIFKQVVKVHQDTVEMYLQDIITEGMEFASSTEASEYVTKLAEEIDAHTSEKQESFSEDENLVADLVHQFVLPEVEKRLVRERVKQRQKKYLQVAHEEIYNKMEVLPKPEYEIPKARRIRKSTIKRITHETEQGDSDTSSSSTLSDDLQDNKLVNFKDNENDLISALNVIYKGEHKTPLDAQSCQLSIMAPFDNQKKKLFSMGSPQESILSKYVPIQRPKAELDLPLLTAATSYRSIAVPNETKKDLDKAQNESENDAKKSEPQSNTSGVSMPTRVDTDLQLNVAEVTSNISAGSKGKKKGHIRITSDVD